MSEWWPWLVMAGLGAFHGINPAMGWLFAVALGLHRESRRVVLVSLLPIAAGHAVAVGALVLAAALAGATLDGVLVRRVGGGLLIVWAAYHAVYGHRHRVRIGMRTGHAGLFLWSFLAATAHGAGLMLVPALVPLELVPSGHGHAGAGFGTAGDAASATSVPAAESIPVALAAVGIHTLAMLLTTAAVAVAVYQWFDLAFLRRGWVNLDVVWTAALVAAGGVLLVV